MRSASIDALTDNGMDELLPPRTDPNPSSARADEAGSVLPHIKPKIQSRVRPLPSARIPRVVGTIDHPIPPMPPVSNG
jgi:hypothetical protein